MSDYSFEVAMHDIVGVKVEEAERYVIQLYIAL
jgi:hypothetical protein